MATTYKTFLNNDIASTRTLLHEAVPVTGSIVSGTYGTLVAGTNIKTYTSDLFESVYDYPYLSSSANHIFDITMGYSTGSAFSASADTDGITSDADIANKINMYNEMAQVLMGHDLNGKIRDFDQDGDLSPSSPTKITSAYFLNFARLLTKDEIKKGTFTLKLGDTTAFASANSSLKTISDFQGSSQNRNSPAGEYGILYTSSAEIDPEGSSGVGLIYYQAGVAVLTSSLLTSTDVMDADGQTRDQIFTGSSITNNANALRHRFFNVEFNNTTELNSTIYFCRVNHNEFNYSSNPTYLSASQIVVKAQQTDAPVSYVTTIGLYSADNELLATAKLSEPLKKDPNNELILRVRLDY